MYIAGSFGFPSLKGLLLTRRSAKNKNLPIFAIQTLNKRTYVVGSADLVAAIERSQKMISFFPVISAISPRLLDVTQDGPIMKIANQNINKDDRGWGLVHETSKGMHETMAPGLNRMNRIMLSIMESYFNELALEGEHTLELFKWIRPRLTIASIEAIKHQPEIGKDFW